MEWEEPRGREAGTWSGLTGRVSLEMARAVVGAAMLGYGGSEEGRG